MILLFTLWPFSRHRSALFVDNDQLVELTDAIELPQNEQEEQLPQKEKTDTKQATTPVKKNTPVPVVNKEIEVVVAPPKEKIKLESQEIDNSDLLTADKQGKYKKNETSKKTTEKDKTTPAPKDNVYYTAVPYMPVPVGGYAAIQSKAVFPQSAKDAGVSGSVFVTAFINEAGVVTSAVLTKGLHPACDNSALSAVRRTTFTPGKKDGKAVKVQMLITVNFFQ